MIVPVLVVVWFISNIACIHLSKKRGLTPGIFPRLIGSFLGPFAIPLIFLLKPNPLNQHV